MHAGARLMDTCLSFAVAVCGGLPWITLRLGTALREIFKTCKAEPRG